MKTLSCKEVYERMDNGLCLFCEELDTPGHHQLKHKGIQIFMTECDDDDQVSEDKTVTNPEPFVETVKNSGPFIEPLKRASVLQDSIDLNQEGDHAKTVVDEKLNLPLGNFVEQVVGLHEASRESGKSETPVTNQTKLPDTNPKIQVTQSYHKARKKNDCICKVDESICDLGFDRINSSDKNEFVGFMESSELRLARESLLMNSGIVMNRQLLHDKGNARASLVETVDTEEKRPIILSRANHVWKPGGLLCVKAQQHRLGRVHSGGRNLKITQRLDCMGLLAIFYIAREFRKAIVDDVWKLVIFLGVHNMKFEAQLEIYNSGHHNSRNPKPQETSCFLLEASIVEIFGCEAYGKELVNTGYRMLSGLVSDKVHKKLKDDVDVNAENESWRNKDTLQSYIAFGDSVAQPFLQMSEDQSQARINKDVKVIAEKCPEKCQSLLFLVAKPSWITWTRCLIKKYLNKRLTIAINGDLDQKLAGVRMMKQRLKCGDVKFHLKHKWKSRLLQTLLGLECCVDNIVLITRLVRLFFPENHKLLHPEAGLCSQYNDLEQPSIELQRSPGLDYVTYLMFIWNQTLNCDYEADHTNSGTVSVADFIDGSPAFAIAVLVLCVMNRVRIRLKLVVFTTRKTCITSTLG